MTDDEIEELAATGGAAPDDADVPRLRVMPRDPDWTEHLVANLKGKIEATIGNATLILQRSPEWDGLRYDEFLDSATCERVPKGVGIDLPKDGPLDDYMVTYIGHWLSQWRGQGVKLKPKDVARAAIVASKGKGRAYHPVREYLRGLTWDGVPRVDSWLTDFAGVEQGDYSSAIGRMWLIAAVARVMNPGAFVKTMIILEGNQNDGKSTLLRNLCPRPEWFADTKIEIGGGKDQFQALRGKWIYEIGELDGFKGKEAHAIKSFVSSPIDNYRRSYGDKNEDIPRQCVFAGSTNETHYLVDGTGNVRFWPVKAAVCGPVRYGAIESVRDQLWAEALGLYLDGKRWHIEDRDLEEQAQRETEEREEEDAWLAPIKDWSKGQGASECFAGVTVSRVLSAALSLTEKDKGKPQQTRCGILMKKLGFERVDGSKKPRKYRKVSDE